MRFQGICIHLISLLLSVRSESKNENELDTDWSRSQDKNDKVIGGREAVWGEFPYQIALLANNRFICGGFFIRPNAVVTAAHCVQGNPNTDYKVRYSTLENANGPTISVKKAIPHPRYNPRTITNDIALLILSTPFISGQNAKTIDIARSLDPQPNSIVTVSGWGRVSVSSNAISSVLRAANLTVMNRRACSDLWSPMAITKDMVCAFDSARSSCNGDSGGPLVQKAQIVGIVSFGSNRCLHEKLPNVYTKVSSFTPWIEQNLKLFSPING